MNLSLPPLFAVIDWAFYIYAAVAAIASAASTYVSYSAQQDAAEQANLNAEAQRDALEKEQQQRAGEIAEQQRRKSLENRRFRATQLAEMSGQGIQITGTPLDIMSADAERMKQEQLDIGYMGDTQRRALQFQADNALAQGRQQASQYRSQAGATLLSGAASAANTYGSYQRPKTA